MADTNDNAQLRELNDRLDRMVDRAKARTKDFWQLWQDGLNYVFDNQLSGKTRREGWERIAIDRIWPATIQEVALQMQQRIALIYLPGSNDPSDIDAAKVWQDAAQWQWEKDLKMTLKRIQASMDSKIYGYSVTHNWWEPKYRWNEQQLDWEGKTCSEVIMPAYFGADPEAESADDWEYCYTERDVRLGWAKQRWPEKAKDLEEAARQDIGEGGSSPDPNDWFMNLANVDKGVKNEGQIVSLINSARKARHTGEAHSSESEHPDDRIIILQQVHFKDYETRKKTITEKVPQEELAAQGTLGSDENNQLFNPQTGQLWTEENWPTRELRKYDEPLYPNGRYVLRVGRTILNPKPADQRWAYRDWGYVIKPNYMLPHIWQGMGSAPMSKDLQNWMNVVASHLTNYLKFFGDPHVVVEQGALAKNARTDKPRLLSKAGGIWQVIRNGINRIRVENPPPLPSGILTFFNLMGQEIRNQTGMQEIVQGVAGKKMTATESTRLNANSRLRVALQGVIEEQSLRRTVAMLAEINQKNWSVGQWVRVVGANKQRGIQEITQGIKDSKFDVDIEIGTALPFDREKRRQDYMTISQIVAQPTPNPMLPELLTEFEIANKDEILQRTQVYQQFVWVQHNFPMVMQWVQEAMRRQQQEQQQGQQQGPNKGAA